MKKFWPLVFLFFLSLVLHLTKLGRNPTFISDEASIGYNAYSILKTGRDEWGARFPLAFKAFGEYKLPFYIYLTVLPIWVFGLTELATRFPSAFFGALSVVPLFLIVGQLFSKKKKNQLFAFLAAFLFAVNPWHLQTSRMAIEANLALFLFLTGFYFFQKEKLSLAAIFFAFTFYAYNAFRVFIPLFLILSLIFKKIELKKLVLFFLIFIVLLFPLVFSGFRGTRERFFKVGLFSDPGIVLRIEERRIACHSKMRSTFCRLVYNRPVIYSSEIFRNYLSHFNPKILFFEGSGLAQYAMPSFGYFYIFEAPTMLLGMGLFFKKGNSLKQRLLPWLVAAPVANSFTGPIHPVRSLVIMPLLVVFSAWGAAWLLGRLVGRKWLFGALFGLVIIFSLGNFSYLYFKVYPAQTGSIWQSGYKPLSEYLRKYRFSKRTEAPFNQIVITKFYGEPHIFDFFYGAAEKRFRPSDLYRSSGLIVRYDRGDLWVNVDRFGSRYYWDQKDFPSLKKFLQESEGYPEGTALVILAPSENMPGLKPDEFIYYQNGEVAFKIYQINRQR